MSSKKILLPRENEGVFAYRIMTDLFSFCRSLTGNGVRKTFSYLQKEIDSLEVFEIPSGTECFDWTIPEEWNVREAFVLDPEGRRILDFKENNLHLVGYSLPINEEMSLEALDEHLYSLPDQPDLIPYVTSYYSPRWGFCLSHSQRESLLPGRYRVVIDSHFSKGSLTYAEALLPGEESQEVLLSTYVCHPSLANDNLSGPALLVALYKWLASQRRRFSYRFIFVPETIGAIAYISKNLDSLRTKTCAGYVVTCVGDDRTVSFLPSRQGDSITDKISRHVLRYHAPEFREYSFLDRGSDERQYCAPGVDLPVASIMRSKYGEYPEYHTSADNLDLVSPQGLQKAFELYCLCLNALEANRVYQVTTCCEPQLGKRGLYPTLSMKGSVGDVRMYMDMLAYADGEHDLVDIAEIIGVPVDDLFPLAQKFCEHGLLRIHDAVSK